MHIDDVRSGLACNCRCLNCSGQLIARKGLIRAAHFTHRSGSDCQGLAEGVLHRLAKEILCSASHIWIPAYHWTRASRLPDGAQLTRGQELTRAGSTRILKAVPEYRARLGFVPDVRLQVGGAKHRKELFVEIMVTHAIDRRKRRLIRKQGTPTIEIRLETEDLGRPLTELHDKVLGPSRAKSWVFHPAQVKHELAFIRALREAYQSLRRQRPTLPPRLVLARRALKPSSVAKSFMTMDEVRRLDAEIEAFNQKHGRYPSLEESKRIFAGRR